MYIVYYHVCMHMPSQQELCIIMFYAYHIMHSRYMEYINKHDSHFRENVPNICYGIALYIHMHTHV